MPDESAKTVRRSGAQTRAEVQRVALELFSTQGYEATSMQRIADELGIKKASLYYHFAGKDEILRSLFEGRSDEARALAEWVRGQPPSPQLARDAVLRWIDSFSLEKLRGIRFMNANPLLFRSIAAQTGRDIGNDLGALQRLLIGDNGSAEQVLLLRMAFMSIGTAVAAAQDVPGVTDEQTIASARACALALADQAFAKPLARK